MTDRDFTTSFTVDHTPEEVFTAINNVRGWWSEEIEGSTDKLGEEFRHHFKGPSLHREDHGARRMLRGPHGGALRVGDHERRMDGRDRRTHRLREDRTVASGRVLWNRSGPAGPRTARADRTARHPGSHDSPRRPDGAYD